MGEINVVPYIDVMLVLLVIFMITAPLLKTGVEVDLPQAEAKPLDTDVQPIVVSVNAEGDYLLNDQETAKNLQEIATTVAAMLRLAEENGEKPSVLVAGDRAVDYGSVVIAIAALKEAGVPQVGLMTEPGK